MCVQQRRDAVVSVIYELDHRRVVQTTTIDLLWRNILSPDRILDEVSECSILLLLYANFLTTARRRKLQFQKTPARFAYPYWQNSDLWQMDTAYAAIAERQDLEGGRSSEVHHPRCQESFTLMSASFNKNLRCRRGTGRRVVSVNTVRSVADMFV